MLGLGRECVLLRAEGIEGSNFQGNFQKRVCLRGVNFLHVKEFLEIFTRAKQGAWIACMETQVAADLLAARRPHREEIDRGA